MLVYYAFQGSTIHWIKSFLCNRGMQVVVDSETTCPALVVSGVLRGLDLGPLLFNIYISDMSEKSHRIDLNPPLCGWMSFLQAYCITRKQQILQNYPQSYSAIGRGMIFNASKCNIMHIARTKTKPLVIGPLESGFKGLSRAHCKINVFHWGHRSMRPPYLFFPSTVWQHWAASSCQLFCSLIFDACFGIWNLILDRGLKENKKIFSI